MKPDSACDDLAAPTGGPQQGAAETQRGEGTGMRFFARSIPDPFGQPAPKKAESLQLILPVAPTDHHVRVGAGGLSSCPLE